MVLDGGGARSFFVLSLPSNTLTLRSLVLRNGMASASPQEGGAVLVAAGSLTLDGCRFVANKATLYGGAVAVGVGSVNATGCVFESNEASDGGAFAMLDGWSAGPPHSALPYRAPSLGALLILCTDPCVAQVGDIHSEWWHGDLPIDHVHEQRCEWRRLLGRTRRRRVAHARHGDVHGLHV